MRNTSAADVNSNGQVDLFLISVAAFPIIMTFGTVTGNIFVLIAVSLSNGHPTKLLIANLAAADLLVGMVFPLLCACTHLVKFGRKTSYLFIEHKLKFRF
ncbi:unnamed protein product [Gongylonema pulchrum]|uniref:G_PROTEIN_RECEP_F1_2 domain-containing protein n=1 Tax=Gongylonema pulchrum TaxID=637853 RepID=A0A183CZK4_9BILA|nr:unnamed protein product [Gongylonema pulchrum]